MFETNKTMVVCVIGSCRDPNLEKQILAQARAITCVHVWKPIVGLKNVECIYCGAKAMRSTLKFNGSSGK
jgi:hypothetical protein